MTTACRSVPRLAGAELTFEMSMHGTHWAMNALGVLGCVAALGLSVEDAAKTLATCPTPKGRGRRYHGRYDGYHITPIDDSYNASPVSMRAALSSMAATPPTIMVLGEMLELGAESAAAHDDLINEINTIMPKLVVGLGAGIHHAMQKLDSRITACTASDTDLAVTAIDAAVAANDIVFIKGSLGSGAWRVASVVLQRLDLNGPQIARGILVLPDLLTPLAEQFQPFNPFRYITFRTGGATITALFISLFFGPAFIRWLKSHQAEGCAHPQRWT